MPGRLSQTTNMLAAIFVLTCGGVPVIDRPPLRIAVSTTADIPPALVQRMIEEVDAIWKNGGISFVWQRANEDRLPADLHVGVSNLQRLSRTGLLVLGLITTDARHLPARYIHISHAHAVAVLHEWLTHTRLTLDLPPLQRDIYLGRAMGRVLAHELGHYLLASNTHARSGLMQASLSAETLFGPSRVTLDMSMPVCKALGHN